MYFVFAGTESIKLLETLSAPLLLLVGVFLVGWASVSVGGFSVILERSNQLVDTESSQGGWHFFAWVFVPWLTAMVGFWATLALNIPDFTRYAKSQKDQVLGQSIGLLTTMPLFAFVGVAVTTATIILYGEAIWNPVILLERLIVEYDSPALGTAALLAIVLATLSTNIAANAVAPANSFSNLMPRRISFRVGGLAAGLVGILIQPWRLLDSYQTWLIGYSGLLGAVGGVIICDYFFVRRRRLSVDDLYREAGEYGYTRGVNPAAVVAFLAGVGVSLLGKVLPAAGFLFNGAWFFSTGVSFLVYALLFRRPVPETNRSS
jgi:NCS1 family nucleobase:cation symporter-1